MHHGIADQQIQKRTLPTGKITPLKLTIMCGIAGFFSQQERGPETIAAMMDALKNRGPDSMHSVRWRQDGSRSEFSACKARCKCGMYTVANVTYTNDFTYNMR